MNATDGRESAMSVLCRRAEWVLRAMSEGRMTRAAGADALTRLQERAGEYAGEVHVCSWDGVSVTWQDVDSDAACGCGQRGILAAWSGVACGDCGSALRPGETIEAHTCAGGAE